MTFNFLTLTFQMERRRKHSTTTAVRESEIRLHLVNDDDDDEKEGNSSDESARSQEEEISFTLIEIFSCAVKVILMLGFNTSHLFPLSQKNARFIFIRNKQQ